MRMTGTTHGVNGLFLNYTGNQKIQMLKIGFGE